MGKLVYLLFIRLYPVLARLLALFNNKAEKWVNGRQQLITRLQERFKQETCPVIWMHCASLGEFEQGRPLLEALKKQYPGYSILLTFFSPSGYEIRKNYEGAEHIFYLPMDSAKNARKFFDIVQPKLVLFVKYEFWHYYIREAQQRNIPLLLVSGIFRPDQAFFKWYGGFYRKMLGYFRHFFVQYPTSASLLTSVGYDKEVTVSGDTRFDRVQEIAARFEPIDAIQQFCGNHPVIVAGSTWTEDDKELQHYVNTHPDIRFIIAPHDIGADRIRECQGLYKQSMLFSQWATNTGTPATANCLIIDNIGMLSRLYHYATLCYVGGGFGDDGIHNILEAAVYSKPVIFGPVYDKYQEGIDMIAEEGAFSITNALELESTFNRLLSNESLYRHTCLQAGSFIQKRTGATESILRYIQENRLLTN